MTVITLNANAKINLSLDVLGKRDDGYHNLRMIMQTVGLHDTVTLETIPEGLEVVCSSRWVPSGNDNIAYKAAELIMRKYKLKTGLRVKIDKRIPVAAGLAGGSADAAGVIKAMNTLFELNMSAEEMMNIGVKVGADVPFCILESTALAEGIGEVLTPLKPLEDGWIVLAKPNIYVSTKEVYGRLKIDEISRHPNTAKLVEYVEKGDIRNIAFNMVNTLETVTIKDHPVIFEIKNIMMDNHALGSLMSGSGPTVFGIFEDKNTAEKCYNRLRDYLKEVYMVKTHNKEV
jgi:4-diphosphocytidyl-2-C-methyl-D-erythritol kinase